MKRLLGLTALLVSSLLALSPATLARPLQVPRQQAAFQIRLGVFLPDGGGQVWDDNAAVFTLDANDFDDSVVGFSYVHSLNNNLEAGFNVDFFDATVISEYRNFVDGAGFPIFHDTRLEVVPFTVDVRFLPFGRYGSNNARRPVFYVGGGGGLSFWEYEEYGDFIDFASPMLDIFGADFRDSGTTTELHALAGFELPVSPSFNVLFEGRYSWADDDLGGDFAGLGNLELGGASVQAGAAFRF